MTPSPDRLARPIAAPAPPEAEGDAMRRLSRALAELKAQAALPLLQAAAQALGAGRLEEAQLLAAQVRESDPDHPMVWHLTALCREQAGDLNGALFAFERALTLSPADADLANDLGRLAMQMGMVKEAETLFRQVLVLRPDSVDGANNLGCALRDQLRYADALEVLRPAIERRPDSALLWNTLGSVITEDGQTDQALVFFDEAVRLDPRFSKARYNRANVRLSLGDPAGALEDCETAIAQGGVAESEALMMRFARSTMLAAAGRVGEAWDAYEARLNPRHTDVTHFMTAAPTWTPDTPLEGARLLVFGEQGLGDEVMFANVLPDLLEALGPAGQLTLAVERRLIPLFARSFPSARVGAHATWRVEHHTVRGAPFAADETFDAWAPMGSLLRRFRRSADAFPARPAFFKADPARVAHWRNALAELGGGLKAGLLWKSLTVASQRARFYSPFDGWAPVLATPGVRFVNLQYGDSAAEIAHAREAFGVDVWTPPGVDLKADLDEVAALSSALDVVLGPANATSNIAAACGTPAWFVCPPGAWPLLGTDRYPWYPRARVFTQSGFDRWGPVMAEVAQALAEAALAEEAASPAA